MTALQEKDSKGLSVTCAICRYQQSPKDAQGLLPLQSAQPQLSTAPFSLLNQIYFGVFDVHSVKAPYRSSEAIVKNGTESPGMVEGISRLGLSTDLSLIGAVMAFCQ